MQNSDRFHYHNFTKDIEMTCTIIVFSNHNFNFKIASDLAINKIP